ncbi:hypothetical protein [Streptomyces sp. NPDC006446]|uniref:hypothetical protein n=1 Tax=Streptomyces sp. NPDC006446 TaxID=3154301 RepID=UPI0033A3A8E0
MSRSDRPQENALLTDRIARRDGEVAKLTAFRALAISRLAAQHEEIERLRSRRLQEVEAHTVVTHLEPAARIRAVPSQGWERSEGIPIVNRDRDGNPL